LAIRVRGWFNCAMNLSRIVERWAELRPAHVAVHFAGEDISYSAFWRRVEAATLRLASLGIHRGDRVAYLGYNHPEALAILFACARLGAMLVPLNFRLARAEHEEILAHAEPSVIVVDRDSAVHAEGLRARFPQLKLVALTGAAEGWFAWQDAPLSRGVARSAGGFCPKLEGEDADPVLLVYTSGTTGKPKGAVHTQAALLWNIVNATLHQDLTSRDHVLTVLPMFHVGGMCIQTLPALHAGATATIHPRFDPGAWLRDVAARRPTTSLLVPATLKAVFTHPDWDVTDLSSLRELHTGSSTIPESFFAPFHARGVPVGQVYGATETGPVSICLRAEEAMRKVGSAGKAAVHCEIRLVDAAGRDVKPGEVGEIWVRAPNLMSGYWKDPDNPSFRGGWFHTGDLARQDGEGYYWVVGRAKEMIISGGENVYPAELENVLAECPDIAEAAVVGVPDPKWGEAVVAAIVRKQGSTLDEAAVLKLFEGRLARFKHPRRVVFVERLPKSALGKVQKPEVRRLLGGG
jgi:fatty-acyl-CoA synthase